MITLHLTDADADTIDMLLGLAENVDEHLDAAAERLGARLDHARRVAAEKATIAALRARLDAGEEYDEHGDPLEGRLEVHEDDLLCLEADPLWQT